MLSAVHCRPLTSPITRRALSFARRKTLDVRANTTFNKPSSIQSHTHTHTHTHHALLTPDTLPADFPMTDSVIHTAVDTWCDDPVTGAIVYGNITTWDTSAVTDMSSLFSGKVSCNPDISSWDTSSGMWLDREDVKNKKGEFESPTYGWPDLTTRTTRRE
jgi:hypothetical protein